MNVPGKTRRTEELLPFVLQPAFDSLSSFVRELLRNGFRHLVGMVVCRVAQEPDLLAVAAAPFTDQEVEP